MLKFIFVAFLFLGLAVSSSEQAAVSENQDQEQQSESTEKFVSEDHNEEFDQNDDVGSKAMLSDSSEEQQEQDDSSSWCALSKCKSFMAMKKGFLKFRGYCIRCLKSRHCKNICRRYNNYRNSGYKRCMSAMRRVRKRWRAILQRNFRNFARAHNLMKRYFQFAAYWNRRCQRKSWKQIVRLRGYYLRRRNYYKKQKNKAQKMMAIYWRRRSTWLKKWRAKRSNNAFRMRFVKNNRLYKHWVQNRNAAIKSMNYYNRKFVLMGQWLQYKKKYFSLQRSARLQRKRKKNLLKRRRKLKAARNRAVRRMRAACARRYRNYRKACVYCHGRCGNYCWKMHIYYAHMVMQAHRCKLKKFLCSRKYAYGKYFKYFVKKCARCKRSTDKRVRTLYCAAACGSQKKYQLLFNYYKNKC